MRPATTSATPMVGVALPVPDPWGSEVQERRIGYGDVRAHHIPTHITLLPPTPLEEELLEPLRDHLRAVAATHPPFEVMLRGTGTFRPVSEVVYLQVAQGVSSCERLERAVRRGPVQRDLTFPYHPHVTLAHDVPPDVLDRAFAELSELVAAYRADSFRLYLHGGDGDWRVVEDFPLSGPPHGPSSAG